MEDRETIEIEASDYQDLVDRGIELDRLRSNISVIVKRLQLRAHYCKQPKQTYESRLRAKGRADAYVKAWKLIATLRK